MNRPLALVAVFCMLFSCQPTVKGKREKTVVLSGTIHNTDRETVKIGEYSAALDDLGLFSLRFELEEADYFLFDCGEKFTLFLSPGDEIFLEANLDSFLPSLSFSGEGAAVNNYLKTKSILEEEHSQKIAPVINQIFSLGEGEFVAKLDSFQTLFLEPLNEFLAAYPSIDKKFAKYERAKLLYSWAEGRMAYPQLHRRLTGQSFFEPSETYYDFLSSLDLDDMGLLSVEEFRSFLSAYFDYKRQTLKKDEPDLLAGDNQNTTLQFRAVLSTFSSQVLKNLYLYESLKNQIENYGILGIENLMADFEANCSNKKYLKEIRQLYSDEKTLREGAETRIYKTVGAIPLEIHLFFPEDPLPRAGRRPAVVFFHGGGWSMGKAEWAFGRCRYFASRGMVAASAQYRLLDRHGTTPLECIADAKSAIRWIRQNADGLNIDPGRVAAGGWSAGGHIAACAAVIEGFDESREDKSISSIPDALVFWFPAVYLKNDTWFRQILRGRVDLAEVSPAQQVRAGLPPAIIFQGTADTTVSLEGVKILTEKMRLAGNRCDLHIYEGREHLFHRDPHDYIDTMIKADLFLSSLGFLEGEPDIDWLNK